MGYVLITGAPFPLQQPWVHALSDRLLQLETGFTVSPPAQRQPDQSRGISQAFRVC